MTDGTLRRRIRTARRSDTAATGRDAGQRGAGTVYVDPDSSFFIVAEGIDGDGVAEGASAMAIDVVRGELEQARGRIDAFARTQQDAQRQEVAALVESAIRAAHRAIQLAGEREPQTPMEGTTLDLVVLAGNEAVIGHVGDGRVYLVRDGQSIQVTIDHTMADMMRLHGQISAEDANVSPLRAMLVNEVGAATGDIVVEISHLPLREQDRLLLCGIGLYGAFEGEQEIADQLAPTDPDLALARAVSAARRRGDRSEITALLLDIVELEQRERDLEAHGDAATEFDDGPVTQPIEAWDAVVTELRGGY
jgi:serine/threonine protein phosphatase PrpC